MTTTEEDLEIRIKAAKLTDGIMFAAILFLSPFIIGFFIFVVMFAMHGARQ